MLLFVVEKSQGTCLDKNNLEQCYFSPLRNPIGSVKLTAVTSQSVRPLPLSGTLTRMWHRNNTKVNRTNWRLVPLLCQRQLPSPLLSPSRLTASFPLPPHQPSAQKERDVLLAWVTLSFQPLAVLLLSIEKSGSSGHSLICKVQKLSVESHWRERNEGAGDL